MDKTVKLIDMIESDIAIYYADSQQKRQALLGVIGQVFVVEDR